MTIRMKVIDESHQHFAVSFDRPGRIEIRVTDGEVMAYVYEGAKVDLDQEPLGAYDATVVNESWVSFADLDTLLAERKENRDGTNEN